MTEQVQSASLARGRTHPTWLVGMQHLWSGEPSTLGERFWQRVFSKTFLAIATAVVEFAVVAATTFLACAIYHFALFDRMPSVGVYFSAALGLAAIYTILCGFQRDYSITQLRDPRAQLRAVFLHWNSAYSLFVFALFLAKVAPIYSRGVIVTQYALGLAAVMALRFLAIRAVAWASRTGRLRGKRVLVFGTRSAAVDIARRLRLAAQGIEVIGPLTLSAPSPGAMPESAAWARELNRLVEVARRATPDDIVVAVPWTEDERIRATVEALAVVPAAIHLGPDRSLPWFGQPKLARVGKTVTLRLGRAPLTLRDRTIKRAFDFVVSISGLLVLSPLLVLVALAIKLDSRGPVFFRQQRYGFNQRTFRIFKFRTMHTQDDGPVVRQATREDQRVTRVGRCLRRTNIDELPQLINVIRGEMSLVGPRPHAVAHNCEYEEKIRLYARRHNVKPGITGWAQVNGYRGETDTDEKMRRRVECDFHYIDRWSFAFDIRILLRTVLSPKVYSNAY